MENDNAQPAEYRASESQQPSASPQEGALEKITGSYKTRVPEQKNDLYSIDNCGCPSCGCMKGNLLLVLSPAGVAAATTAAVYTAPK